MHRCTLYVGLLCLLQGLARSAVLSNTIAQQVLFVQDTESKKSDPVPGDSPLVYCDVDREDDLFQIDTVDLYPDPPERGHYFTIDAHGAFTTDVGDDPQFTLNATFGNIHSIDTVAPLCDHVDVVQEDKEVCPPKKGKALLTYTNFINEMMMPPGNYTQKVDAYTQDGKRLFCVFAKVTLA